MKPHDVLIYLAMLVAVALVALISGQMQDEAQRVTFSLWAMPAAVLAVFLAGRFLVARSRLRARESEPSRRTVAPNEPGAVSDRPVSLRLLLILVSGAGALLILSWLCLIYLGAEGGDGAQTTARIGIRMVTIVVTTVTALLLSRLAPALQPQKAWVLQLSAVLQIVFAFFGLLVLPVIALTIWNDYVDFQAYSLKLDLLLMLVPSAAVVFCLTRVSGAKNGHA
jgi:uncharacterized membrane protein YqjE